MMDRSRWSPSIVLGIDFGMTCTGIAYSSEESDWSEPQVIQYWPGHSGLANKCPSQVAYSSAGRLVDWGHCTRAQGIATSARYFKMALDKSFQEPTLSHEDATRYYIDYMSELNKHVDARLAQRFNGWYERSVEYRFSIPTNWTSPRLAYQLKKCLVKAGFVDKGNRRVVFTRTEAEAAAIYAADFVKTGDIFMVIDAGGATTDINLLKVMKKTGEVNQMAALDKAEGIGIGSVRIDQAAHELITRKLETIGFRSGKERRYLADQMMENSSFDLWKSDYGSPNSRDTLYLEVPPQNRQCVVLQSSELKEIFDILITELMDFVRHRIHSMADSHPQQLLQYIILSGGLGSSAYLKHRLVAEFCASNRQPRNCRNLQVLQAKNPQLAVVKGLVKDRPSSAYPLPSSFVDRRARASYGVLTSAKYDSKLHFGQPTFKDELSGKVWVEDQIDWIIKEVNQRLTCFSPTSRADNDTDQHQGDKVEEDGYRRQYTLRVSQERRLKPFRCTIVTSELPASGLPSSMTRGPVTVLCTVHGRFEPGDFDAGHFDTVRRGLFSRARDHDVATFFLKIMVGSADLAFEFEALDGRKYSEESACVDVVWEDALAP